MTINTAKRKALYNIDWDQAFGPARLKPIDRFHNGDW